MTGQLTLRGVPRSIAQDGWWLSMDEAIGEAPPPPKPRRRSGGDLLADPHQRLALILALLVALGDFLFWHHEPGISLVLSASAPSRLSAQRVPRLAGSLSCP